MNAVDDLRLVDVDSVEDLASVAYFHVELFGADLVVVFVVVGLWRSDTLSKQIIPKSANKPANVKVFRRSFHVNDLGEFHVLVSADDVAAAALLDNSGKVVSVLGPLMRWRRLRFHAGLTGQEAGRFQVHGHLLEVDVDDLGHGHVDGVEDAAAVALAHQGQSVIRIPCVRRQFSVVKDQRLGLGQRDAQY